MTREEAVGFLQESGWLQDHDRQIYEQGKRDGIEERKTGRWIEIGYVENDNYNFMCSECRYTDTHTKAEKVNYCWHCGAMMEGEDEPQKEEKTEHDDKADLTARQILADLAGMSVNDDINTIAKRIIFGKEGEE